jgi:hypothetical protein
METHHIEIAIRPLSAWSDEQISLAYRLVSGDVQDLLAAADADPQELAASRRDAELFGVEAMRRGLAFG